MVWGRQEQGGGQERGGRQRDDVATILLPSHNDDIKRGEEKKQHKNKQGQGLSPVNENIKDGREEKDNEVPTTSSETAEQRRVWTIQRTHRT